jgi:glutathione S-transferase
MIARLEKGLAERVELVWTRTRNPDDPMLAVNPSGRIPFLLLDDGTGYEDTDVIIPYLDGLVTPLRFEAPGGEAYWPFRRLRAMARGMLDGVSVWAREVSRPENEQSSVTIDHETRRARRLAAYFDGIVAQAPLAGPLNTVQLLLFCALDVERRLPALDWRSGHAGLVDWHARMLDVPAVAESVPPPGA